MKTSDELLDVVKDYIDEPVEKIDLNEGLKFMGGIDSFVLLSLISAIEERFSIRIPNEKLFDFKTLNDIVSYIDSVRS